MGALLLTLFSMFAGQAPTTQLYQHTECAFSFEYPRDWQIVKNPDYVSEECATTLQPLNNRLHTVTVQVSERSFLQVGAEQGFDFDGRWLVLGRQGSSGEAQVTNTDGWLILRGTATVGCQAGGRSVLCDELRVIAKRKDDDRVVSIVGSAQTAQILELLLKTFKFR